MFGLVPRNAAFLLVFVATMISVAACSDPDDDADTQDDAAVTDADDAAGDDATDAITDPFGDGYVIRVELGEHPTASSGYSSEIAVSLPAGTTAAVITVEGPADIHFNLSTLASATGLSIVPKAWISLAGQARACLSSCPNRVVSQPGTASFLLPNTPVIKLPKQGLTFRVYAFTRDGSAYKPRKTTFKAWVHLVRKTAEQRTAGTLAINIGATGAGGLNAKNVLADARVSKALKQATLIFAKAGIDLTPIRAFDAAQIPLIVQQEGDKAELTKLFRSGKGQPLGVNIFLVDKVLSASGGGPGANVLSGVSGGIPGPPLIVGSARSGVALSLDLAPGQPDTLGPTLAHELAHFLGLFHTIEASSGGKPITDELPDTGEDTGNLMHWSVDEDGVAITHGQRHVLHHSPWVVPKK